MIALFEMFMESASPVTENVVDTPHTPHALLCENIKRYTGRARGFYAV